MFVGHFAVALAAKRAAPKVSLGTLFLACEFVDAAWPVLLLLGIEQVRIAPGITAFTPLDFISYPWTHSLLMGAVWALVLAVAFRHWVVGLLVLSHWFLDAIVHRPDLPLVPGGEARLGLGLWNSIPGTLGLELAMFAAGLLIYARFTRAVDRKGSIGFWALIAVLLVSYFGAAFGPPPPSVEALAWTGIAGAALTAAWAYWVERHRGLRA
jgi:hypothetical protein